MYIVANEADPADRILEYLPAPVREALLRIPPDERRELQEIRMRAGNAVTVTREKTYFLSRENGLSEKAARAVTVSRDMLRRSLDRMCQNSVYASQNELRHGFITLAGGHRAGICGKTVIEEGRVAVLSDISSINLRIAHQVKGAADAVMDYLTEGGISNAIVISPPSCGKTTLLRDIARQLAGERYMYRVGIVDERSEIAAMYRGEAQNDVGALSDVYDNCPKAEGMLMLLRAMAPDVIITDEIGGRDDADAIHSLVNAGVKVICSAHGYDREDVLRREGISELIKKGVFKKIIVLSRRNGAGTIEKMY